MEIHFVKPTYVGDVLELEATVKERRESRQVVVLQFRFRRETTLIANGRVTVRICNL